MNALGKWAIELNIFVTVLETGIKQPEAMNLYLKSGYIVVKIIDLIKICRKVFACNKVSHN